MDGQKFLNAMQQKVAYESLQPRALGFINEDDELMDCRNFAGVMKLSRFATEDRKKFENELDKATEELVNKLSANHKIWGIARSAINIFLQSSLYNRYLSESYDLYLAEHLYELPLNKRTIDGLRRFDKNSTIPEWSGLNLLEPDLSVEYQSFASQLSDRMGVSRIHLTMFLWPGWNS